MARYSYSTTFHANAEGVCDCHYKCFYCGEDSGRKTFDYTAHVSKTVGGVKRATAEEAIELTSRAVRSVQSDFDAFLAMSPLDRLKEISGRKNIHTCPHCGKKQPWANIDDTPKWLLTVPLGMAGALIGVILYIILAESVPRQAAGGFLQTGTFFLLLLLIGTAAGALWGYLLHLRGKRIRKERIAAIEDLPEEYWPQYGLPEISLK